MERSPGWLASVVVILGSALAAVLAYVLGGQPVEGPQVVLWLAAGALGGAIVVLVVAISAHWRL